MYKAHYNTEPQAVSTDRQRNFRTGETFIHVRITAQAEKVTDADGRELWTVNEHAFSEKESLLDLADLQAHPEAYLHYIPHATRQAAKDEAQTMLDALRTSCPVVSVPSYREGAAVCNRPADQVKLVAGLAMGSLPYYELASGEVVSLSADDIKAIAADITAAETSWQQAKQACWAAIDTAREAEDITEAFKTFKEKLSCHAVNSISCQPLVNPSNNSTWLAGLTAGWGIRESWAKYLAGSLAGALAASSLLTGCTPNPTTGMPAQAACLHERG